MLRMSATLVGVVMAALSARAAEPLGLFDGKSLDGWVVEGEGTYPGLKETDPVRSVLGYASGTLARPGFAGLVRRTTWAQQGIVRRPIWTVDDGLLCCHGHGYGFLRYTGREFTDFVLTVEYRMAPPVRGRRCNSGIGIRTVAFDPKRSDATRPSYYSYEIQLLDDADRPPDKHSTGSLYRYVAPKVQAARPAPEWNTLEVECVGPRLRTRLNGRELYDVDQSALPELRGKPLKGYVCLQNHGGRIDFRKVHVRDSADRAP